MSTAPPDASERRRTWPRVLRWLLLVVVVLALGIPLATAGLVVATSRSDVRTRSDAIIVLGAAQFDGRPSPVLQSRLEHAQVLYDDGVSPRIITVGGNRPGDRYTEAEAGRNWLVDAGVPSRRITAVPVGRDTLTSLEAVAAVMQEKHLCTAVLVSDPWHALRTQTMARDLGIDAVSSPTRSGPTQSGTYALRYIVRETAATTYYVVAQSRHIGHVVTGCG